MPNLCIPPETLNRIECRKSKHYAIIKHGGKIIATGYNQPGAFRFKGKNYMRHAECVAIKNLPRKFIIKGTAVDMIVIRQGWAESKPCQHCIDYMRKHGVNIRRVRYSSQGQLITESLNTMENSHLTVHWICH